MTVKIKYNTWFLRKSWIGGLTIYPFIFFKRSKEEVTDRLFRHELEHIYQVQAVGWIKFYALYLLENLRNGYKNNKYELAAEAVQDRELTAEERALKDNS